MPYYVHSTANLRIFLRKAHLFLKNPNFEHFEKFYSFSRILRQVCYLYRFQKNSRYFFEKPIYFLKNPNFWTFRENLLFQSHSTANLLTLAILKNQYSLIFSEKLIYLVEKNPKSWTFWEILLFLSHSPANLLQFNEKKFWLLNT